MNTNQAGWPGEPPANLASTSTREVLELVDPVDSQPSQVGPASRGKRQRSALSCAECRRLKLKCSRTWPCTSCIKRKCAHICPDDVLKEVRPPRSKEVGALQERIYELEQQLAAATGQQPAPATLNILPSSGEQDPLEPFGGPQADERHPGVSDVAEVMGTLLLGEDGSSRYLGKSAANAWFHESASAEEEASTGSEDEDDDDMQFQGTAFPMVSKGLEVQDFQAMLPPISDARHLANTYYDNCAFMFEPLQRAVFDKHLEAAYAFSSDEYLITLEQLSCVFMVFALGVLFDTNADQKDTRSPKYHSIAQACLTSARFLIVPSPAAIQCLHLMCTWQLTSHSQTGAFRAWPLLGLACRMVLSTGLHRDGSIWAIPEPDLSIRRSLFWELACYDRLQGLILGRPYMINSKHFDTIMPTAMPGQPYEGEAIEFHRYKYELCLIIGELCDDCFSIGRPGYDTILLHDRRLRQFKESLPQWLRFEPATSMGLPAPPPGSRELRQIMQQHTLTVQIHETLLFLHRVAFAQAIEHYPLEPVAVGPERRLVVLGGFENFNCSDAVSVPSLPKAIGAMVVHCFGAGVCFAAVCIKAPASALTRLAWSELCDATALLESTVNEGVHGRDLYPRLRKLRDQAQHKLETHQKNSIAVDKSADADNHSGQGGDSRMGSGSLADPHSSGRPGSPSLRETTHAMADEDDRLAVLGASTRKLEGHVLAGRHPPTRANADRFGLAARSKDREKDRDKEGAPSYNEKPGSAPLTYPPDQSGIRTKNFAGSEHPIVTASGEPCPGVPPPPRATHLQIYDNLDPDLAQVLASISGTTAQGNSATFRMLDDAHGSDTEMAQPEVVVTHRRYASNTDLPATAVSSTSSDSPSRRPRQTDAMSFEPVDTPSLARTSVASAASSNELHTFNAEGISGLQSGPRESPISGTFTNASTMSQAVAAPLGGLTSRGASGMYQHPNGALYARRRNAHLRGDYSPNRGHGGLVDGSKLSMPPENARDYSSQQDYADPVDPYPQAMRASGYTVPSVLASSPAVFGPTRRSSTSSMQEQTAPAFSPGTHGGSFFGNRTVSSHPGDDNYLDSAWMGYFPTPGIGMHDHSGSGFPSPAINAGPGGPGAPILLTGEQLHPTATFVAPTIPNYGQGGAFEGGVSASGASGGAFPASGQATADTGHAVRYDQRGGENVHSLYRRNASSAQQQPRPLSYPGPTVSPSHNRRYEQPFVQQAQQQQSQGSTDFGMNPFPYGSIPHNHNEQQQQQQKPLPGQTNIYRTSAGHAAMQPPVAPGTYGASAYHAYDDMASSLSLNMGSTRYR